jgi:ABC-type polysaccharide/polyol phosphate export permease
MGGGIARMILDKMAAVLKKDLLTALRYRNGFVFAIVAPAIQLATFYYLSRAVGPQFRPDGMPYFLFLIVGTGFYTFLIAGIHSFLQTVQESQQTGTLEVLMTTSTPPPVLLISSAMSAFGSGAVQLVFYVGAGLMLFAAPHVNLAGCALVFGFSVVISIAVGLFAAALQIAIHKGSAVVWLLGSTAWLMAGTLFPVEALPRTLRLASMLLPFTHSLTGMRLALVEGSSQAALVREIEILGLWSILLVPLGIVFFAWTVRRARQLGTLSFY